MSTWAVSLTLPEDINHSRLGSDHQKLGRQKEKSQQTNYRQTAVCGSKQKTPMRGERNQMKGTLSRRQHWHLHQCCHNNALQRTWCTQSQVAFTPCSHSGCGLLLHFRADLIGFGLGFFRVDIPLTPHLAERFTQTYLMSRHDTSWRWAWALSQMNLVGEREGGDPRVWESLWCSWVVLSFSGLCSVELCRMLHYPIMVPGALSNYVLRCTLCAFSESLSGGACLPPRTLWSA